MFRAFWCFWARRAGVGGWSKFRFACACLICQSFLRFSTAISHFNLFFLLRHQQKRSRDEGRVHKKCALCGTSAPIQFYRVTAKRLPVWNTHLQNAGIQLKLHSEVCRLHFPVQPPDMYHPHLLLPELNLNGQAWAIKASSPKAKRALARCVRFQTALEEPVPKRKKVVLQKVCVLSKYKVCCFLFEHRYRCHSKRSLTVFSVVRA